EEPVAILRLDALGEQSARFSDRRPMVAADDGDATLVSDPIEDCVLAWRKFVRVTRLIFSSRFQNQGAGAVVEPQKAAHRMRQGGRGECTPGVAPVAPLIDVVGERGRNAFR